MTEVLNFFNRINHICSVAVANFIDRNSESSGCCKNLIMDIGYHIDMDWDTMGLILLVLSVKIVRLKHKIMKKHAEK